MADALIASPVATRQYLDGLRTALDRAGDSLDQLVTELVRVAVHLGQHRSPEPAGLLLSLSDAVRDVLCEREVVGR
jgi:hypothetical protein